MDIQHPAARTLKTGLAVVGLLAGMISCGGGGYGGGSSNYMPPMQTASSYVSTKLVADTAGAAAHTDTHLVNGWGVAFNPTGYVWVANNGTSTSTLYDGNGIAQSLVVAIPAGSGGDASPTGLVYNGSTDFKVTQNGVTGASAFIFAGEHGTLSGWSPAVNRNAAVLVADGGSGPLYKGLALASYAGANYLYAADFGRNAIDVFNGSFNKVSLPGSFRDPTLPSGYAPFNIQLLGDKLYVAYAKQAPSGGDEVKGAGLGVVAVFDTSGAFVKELVMGGALNAPWGMAMAPANFGSFSNALLVGNFGDGKVLAYNPATGALMGTLSKSDGSAIVIDGLWGIAFGNGINAQPMNTLFYAAGPGDEAHGQYGRIDLQ